MLVFKSAESKLSFKSGLWTNIYIETRQDTTNAVLDPLAWFKGRRRRQDFIFVCLEFVQVNFISNPHYKCFHNIHFFWHCKYLLHFSSFHRQQAFNISYLIDDLIHFEDPKKDICLIYIVHGRKKLNKIQKDQCKKNLPNNIYNHTFTSAVLHLDWG